MSLRSALVPLAVSGLLAGGAGCGRRATRADCQLIVDKSVELQMHDMANRNASAIEKREQEVRSELQSEIDACEGRHVTEETIACVKRATSTKELDGCLR